MAKAIANRDIGSGDGSCVLWTWNLTTADATGDPIEATEWADRTWQFGTAADTLGGAVGAVEGSNTTVSADFAGLSDAAGAVALTFNALGVRPKTAIELPRYMRPKLTTPGAGAIITVTCMVRRANSMRT